MNDIVAFDQITPDQVDAVGGKGLSLGLMAGAGLPVPPGFCIGSAAYRRLKPQSVQSDAALTSEIASAYRTLGGGPVAVRSSATAEDGAVASFAGQQETILGVSDESALLQAIGRCWASLDSDRAIAYRRKQGIDERGLAMAVVVQRLVSSEVSGVLFTRDPMDSSGRRMLVEAAWGLGESVVSGRVSPDRFHLDRATGAVLEQHVSVKRLQIADCRLPIEKISPAPDAENCNLQSAICNLKWSEVSAEKQAQPCLTEVQLAELAELGRRVEKYYGAARDVEWAWAEGKFWLLQARPITAGGAAERAQVRLEEMASLRARAEPAGTVWSRYNLAEVLPEPTPMTWSIVRRFMSGRGGFGLMYRDLGFDPDPALDEEGVYDLVCGRPYCNLSREPRLMFRQLPYEHPFAVLKAAPQRALYPEAIINPSRATWRFWLAMPVLLPVLFWKMSRKEIRFTRLIRTLADRLRRDVFPSFLAEIAKEETQDIVSLDTSELLVRLEYWIKRTLYDFARDSLKPSALALVARMKLEKALEQPLGKERARAAVGELTMGIRPDAEADLPTAIQELANGRTSRTIFLERFGHRGSQEMELSHPRWAEDQDAFDRLIAMSSGGRQPAEHDAASEGLRRPVGEPLTATWNRVAAEAKLAEPQKAALEGELATLHTYLSLRETGKHYLMKGYALIRRGLVELDRRHHLNGGIFFLTLEELPALALGTDMSAIIAQRRRRRAVALSLEVPQVLFSDDLEAIGRSVTVAGADTLQGVPLSAGVAEGRALVLTDPEGAEVPSEPYVLVCPSTDPAWVPLFVHARGLVMETGGVLSHGAIVARELGLPAVAGIADVHRKLKSGQRLRVDGSTGAVSVLPEPGGP
jgi:pyruvate,water dikinase